MELDRLCSSQGLGAVHTRLQGIGVTLILEPLSNKDNVSQINGEERKVSSYEVWSGEGCPNGVANALALISIVIIL